MLLPLDSPLSSGGLLQQEMAHVYSLQIIPL